MTHRKWNDLSEKQKSKWIKKFRMRFGAFIDKYAEKQCIPKQLLAAVIANELMEWRLAGDVLGDGFGGGGIGPAQVNLKAIQHLNLLTNHELLSHNNELATIAGHDLVKFLPGLDSPIPLTSLAEFVESDDGAVSFASRQIGHHFRELCGRFTSRDGTLGAGVSKTFGLLSKRISELSTICNECTPCHEIVDAEIGSFTLGAIVAMYNSGGFRSKDGNVFETGTRLQAIC